MTLPKIDSLSTTLLMDNYTDRLLPSSLIATRPPMMKNEQFLPPPPPVAEHGFSALIRLDQMTLGHIKTMGNHSMKI